MSAISINPIMVDLLHGVTDLEEGNWFQWSKEMKMFFRGCNASPIFTGADEQERVEFDIIDTQLTSYIYAKVSPTYRYLIEDETKATKAWAKLKAYFEKPTHARRIAAYEVVHNPYQPIGFYIHAVSSARETLRAYGGIVDDT